MNEIDQSKAALFHFVRGQALAKRAVEVALAGGHRLLLAVTEYGQDRESKSKIQATESADNSFSFQQAEAMAVAPNIVPKSAKQLVAMSKARRSDLLLRSEMVVDVPAMPIDDMGRPPGEPFDRIWARVEKARGLLTKNPGGPKALHTALDPAGQRLLRRAQESLELPAIRIEQILRVAATVAALEGIEEIHPQHLAEAIQYGRTYREAL